MEIKTGDVVTIKGDGIKIITPVTFVNGPELIFFITNSYNIQTGILKFRDKEYKGCKIKKGGNKELRKLKQRDLLLDRYMKGIIEKNFLQRYLLYLKLWKMTKDQNYKDKFLYRINGVWYEGIKRK